MFKASFLVNKTHVNNNTGAVFVCWRVLYCFTSVNHLVLLYTQRFYSGYLPIKYTKIKASLFRANAANVNLLLIPIQPLLMLYFLTVLKSHKQATK